MFTALLLHFWAKSSLKRGALYNKPWLRTVLYFPAAVLVTGELAFTAAYSWKLIWLQHLLSRMSADFLGRLNWLIEFHFIVYLFIGTGLLLRSYLHAVWSHEAELRR